MKLLQSGNTRSFEHASWSVALGNKTIMVTGVYHPLPKDCINNSMFLYDITDHLTDLLTANQNNLIMGDFNIHIDDPTDSDANIFNDTMMVLGLVQHVSIPTHNKGNTLDLIHTELGTNLSVSKIQCGPMVSDHRLMYTSLNIRKPVVKKDRVTVRKILLS